MAGNTTTTPPPKPATPSAPIIAPVTISKKNSIDSATVITRHIWQEYHWSAKTDKYKGATDEDKRVVEIEKDNARLAKAAMNLSFCETAMACIDVDPPEGEELYLHWWLEDTAGKVVAEHPKFTKANFDDKKADATIAKGSYAWRWDGRRTLEDKDKTRVFMRKEACFSRLKVKSKSRADIPLSNIDTAHILVEGDPYKVFLVGEPKDDAAMGDEFALRKAWIDNLGNRFQADCWIKVFRGLNDSDKHLCFLGQGAMEATEVEDTRHGAIATPHDVDHKAQIIQGTHGKVQFWLCSLLDTQPQVFLKPNGKDAGPWLITLVQTGSHPPANNPFCDIAPKKPFKDGVHTHHSFPDGNPGFLYHGASVGCTTVVDHHDGTRAKPASKIPGVQANSALFGQWNGSSPDKAPSALWGPTPTRSGHKDTFYNKQTKRDDVKDVELDDPFGSPLLTPPPPKGQKGDEEPLHMQPSAQHALFGGFLGHEIPLEAKSPAEPETTIDEAVKVRYRIRLKQAPETTRYWQYHRLAVLGHTAETTATTAKISLYLPRMVQRLWNGHWRNLPLKWQSGAWNAGYAWTFELRPGGDEPLAWIGTKPAAKQEYHDLDLRLGHVEKSVKLPKVDNKLIGQGARLYSVFRYRIKLAPAPKANESMWEPLSSMTDLFGGDASFAAQLEAEQLSTDGLSLEGVSALQIPVGMPTTPPNPPTQ